MCLKNKNYGLTANKTNLLSISKIDIRICNQTKSFNFTTRYKFLT